MVPISPAAFRRHPAGCIKILPAKSFLHKHTHPHSRGAFSPGPLQIVSPREKRAQGMPGACCTRGLACNKCEECAHEHTGTVGAFRHSLRSGFTAYAALSPETNSFCLRHRRIDGVGAPGRARNASADLTPATGARTTRFCRTLQCRSSAAPPIAHRPKPALRSHRRSGRCRVHRIPSQRP